MALPHYKLQTNPLPEAPVGFPVLLAPAEPPLRFAFIKRALRSRLLLISIEILSIAAGAVLLWLWLDPTSTAPKPLHLLMPAVTLGVCVFLLLLMALVKNDADAPEHEAAPELPLPVAQPVAPVQRPAHNGAHNGVVKPEWKLEQWSSKPFVEVLDEAVMAEVLDDDCVAPDHLVLSVKVKE